MGVRTLKNPRRIDGYITITTVALGSCYDNKAGLHLSKRTRFQLRSIMNNKTSNINLRKSINWNTAIFMAIFHVGAIAALFMFSWQVLAVTLVLWWVSGSLGIGMGFHRLLTHRGYKTPKAIEYFLTFCGTLALEGGAINWVVTHRIHHANTDEPGDPHTPRDGRWWSHMGWILRGTAQQHEES